tara:strand:+ start:229 stop:534 length:306 start_codon:yes stop_codon:yes gene_type:complete
MYDYVVHKETGETCYRITDGPFKGVIYKYLDIGVTDIDPDEAETIPVNFDYEVMYAPDTGLDFSPESFAPTIGDILFDEIESGLKEGNVKFNYENRNSGTE